MLIMVRVRVRVKVRVRVRVRVRVGGAEVIRELERRKQARPS